MPVARIDYDRVAAAYDAARGLEPGWLGYWRDAIEPYVPGDGNLPVLDVGAGTGQWAAAFADWFGVRVVAVEPSSAMLAQARAARSRSLVHYLGGVAERLPLRDDSCGLAWLSTVIHHITDLPAAARELRRVLALPGFVLVRGAFPGRTDGITLFRYFPEAASVVESFPTVADTVETFERAGFAFAALGSVPQVSAPSLAAFRERAALRADTTLLGISDDAFARGLRAIDEAITKNGPGGPVVDSLDLLVLRPADATETWRVSVNELLAQADALREQIKERGRPGALPSSISAVADDSAQ